MSSTPTIKIKEWMNCSPEERIERWEQAVRVLEGLDEHTRTQHWDMGVWGRRTPCGTVACAAGHCGLDPWFRERGLQLNMYLFNIDAEDNPDNYDLDPDTFDVAGFFGYFGSRDIFWNGTPRPVETVIEEMKAFIQRLRNTNGNIT
jgi:hypothetical protein